MAFAGLLVAALMGASALLKIRTDRRTGMGTSPATLVELAVAVGVALVPLASGVLTTNVLVLGFGVSIAASVMQARRYGREARRREETEGGRLAAYVRYLSAAEGSGSEDGDPSDGAAGPRGEGGVDPDAPPDGGPGA